MEAPEHLAADEEVEMIGEIDCKQFSQQMVMAALKRVKMDKTHGVDNYVSGDLLEVDTEKTSRGLIDLHVFSIIWQKKKVPEKWERGLIVKFVKKGDMKDCINWRG